MSDDTKPDADSILKRLRAMLDDDGIIEVDVLEFMNLFEELDWHLEDGGDFPIDWLIGREWN